MLALHHPQVHCQVKELYTATDSFSYMWTISIRGDEAYESYSDNSLADESGRVHASNPQQSAIQNQDKWVYTMIIQADQEQNPQVW